MRRENHGNPRDMLTQDKSDHYRKYVRDIADFPKKGVGFKDLTPLFGDAKAFKDAIEDIAREVLESSCRVERVACPEARGFIVGAALACRLGVGFVPIRKPGKLPYKTMRMDYALEYGTDAVEMHVDAVAPGQRVLLVDDVLATGGTLSACAKLVEKAGAMVAGCAFVVELTFLKGRERLSSYPMFPLVRF
jgi:adenine phosphoribosyltransferase